MQILVNTSILQAIQSHGAFGFVLFHFHISELLNNKTIFTDYIIQKLFRYTCEFSHFVKMIVPGPT